VVEHFERVEAIINAQPEGILPMTSTPPLTQEEIDSLPVIIYQEKQGGIDESVNSQGKDQQPDSNLNSQGNEIVAKTRHHSQMTLGNDTLSTTSQKLSKSSLDLTTNDIELSILVLQKTTDYTCALCLEDYQSGERLRELSCKHRYHVDCVDEWLEGKRRCPVCNADAIQEIP
jgi:Ring finger domain